MRKPTAKTKDSLILQMMAGRELAVRRARVHFHEYCRLMSMPDDFYRMTRPHLVLICDTLQALFEGYLNKKVSPSQCVQYRLKHGIEKTVSRLKEKDIRIYRRLMLNIPPRHGKTRTLVNFNAWALGQDNRKRIINASYNDSTAFDFSRYTRDGINAKKQFPYEIDYSDIFPGTEIKFGEANMKKWSLKGQFFNYLGAGIGGSVTSKGCDIAIIDDPIKDVEEAYSDLVLEKIIRWFTGTFISRMEEGAIQIINMTRWATKDLCGYILKSEEKESWYVLEMEALKEGQMLCPEILSHDSYESRRKTMDPAIFLANYHQRPVDIIGKLYKSFKTYTDIPKDDKGNVLFLRIISYTDTADEGDNYLCSITAGEFQKELYIIDVLYSNEGQEVTEGKTAELFHSNAVNLAKIESNNGGKGFAREVGRILTRKYRNNQTVIKWFHQSQNKKARIISNSAWIQEHSYFPVNWNIRWPEFYEALNAYKKEGNNKFDDAPDALTGLAEMLIQKKTVKALDKVINF